MQSRLVLALIATLAAAGAGPVPTQPLYAIPVGSATAIALPVDTPARVRLTATGSSLELASRLGVAASADRTTLEYVIDRYPQVAANATRTWLEPTFVIDFQEPAVVALSREMEVPAEESFRTALVGFVARVIDERVTRGWDVASVVADHRQGDCTEHAVLTVALARMHGIPARVAIGIVLISNGTEHFAAGHAWAELREGDRWVVADAAMHDVALQVRYIPIGIVEEEGIGYALPLMALMQRWIQRVEVLGSA